MKILIALGILSVLILYPCFRMSSICSREEEQEEWDEVR